MTTAYALRREINCVVRYYRHEIIICIRVFNFYMICFDHPVSVSTYTFIDLYILLQLFKPQLLNIDNEVTYLITLSYSSLFQDGKLRYDPCTIKDLDYNLSYDDLLAKSENITTTRPCDKWVYDTENFGETIISEVSISVI